MLAVLSLAKEIMAKQHLIIGSILAGMAVMLGAFGAHALEGTLEAFGRKDTYGTAVQYHMFHALGILAVALLMRYKEHRQLAITSYLFLSGVVLFSGSLYLLSVTNITTLGAITPIGGVMFIAGWVVLVIHLVRHH